MRPLRAGMLVAGIIVGFIALGLVVGGSVLIWAHATQRDAEGFYDFDARPFGTPGYAVTSEDLNLGEKPNDWFPSGLATVRIRAGSDAEVFVGIAARTDVDRYLDGVAHSVVDEIQSKPFRVTYRQVAGDATPAPPTGQTFWAASTSGSGERTLTWELEQGAWVLVVMNADASQGIDVRLAAGVKTGLLLPIGLGLLVFGLLVAVGAITLIVLSTRGKPPASSTATPERPDQVPAG
ncbi:MAG: hypothetical protein ACXWX0_06925 [Actinomycetota bacterium]